MSSALCRLRSSHIRGTTKTADPLKFPYGHIEQMPRISEGERDALQDVMRAKYSVHYTELIDGDEGKDSDGHTTPEQGNWANVEASGKPQTKKPDQADDPDTPDTELSPTW